MKKRFNITGICYPYKHYMVNLDARLAKIKELVDYGDYFVINRARQYGKTTTLWALSQYLQEEYIVLFCSFQKFSTTCFENEHVFVKHFIKMILDVVRNKKKKITGLDEQILSQLEKVGENNTLLDMMELFSYLNKLCETAEKPVVLIIDEVDNASNNQVFLDFLGQLRSAYLEREMTDTFQSVILAGVYDVKNLKHKIRSEEEHRYNSPWNIAAQFDLDMSFSVEDIAGMLEEYEKENHMGMQIKSVAEQIYAYTSGYPFLVSRICMLLDETGKKESWSEHGIAEAVKNVLKEHNTLFDDMQKKLEEYPELKSMLYEILFNGRVFLYNIDHKIIQLATMFGYIKDDGGRVAMTNRIFETRLYNQFISEELVNSVTYESAVYHQSQFIQDGYLNMDLVLKKSIVLP